MIQEILKEQSEKIASLSIEASAGEHIINGEKEVTTTITFRKEELYREMIAFLEKSLKKVEEEAFKEGYQQAIDEKHIDY